MLELKHINKTYKTSKGVETHALKDIDLCFPKKGMVFILGKSGSGKSTLLNVIGGLDQADSGEIIINGKSSRDFSKADYDSYRNTYIGFIFQEFNLMDDYTIEKNIALALQLQQKPEDHTKIEALLEKLDLAGYSGRYPSELSGGQKQRVAIARALVKEPEILMADEPTGALDSSTGKEIFDTLKELSKEKLVIVVSHDKESATKYADRIIEFKDGRIDSDSAPKVEVENEEFHAIRSHLPFKDSFKLGFSCLGHKKVRMVFTILLTSFALLTLALSDAIGAFNGANAQHKAMQEQKEPLAGIRMQYVDSEGQVYRYWGGSMNPISEKKAAELINGNDAKFARVYDSDTNAIGLGTMGVGSMNRGMLDDTVRNYYLTEMGGFEDLGIADIEGTYPKTNDEVAISSYLADIILRSGILDKDGNLQRPKDYKELMSTIKIPVMDKWLSVSGIAKKDLSAYEHLRDMRQEQLDNETGQAYHLYASIVNKDCDKLFVKDGFVKSLELPKNNVLSPRMGQISYSSDGMAGTGRIAFPTETFKYFDGTSVKESTSLAKDEIVLNDNDALSIYQNNGNSDVWERYYNLDSKGQKAELEKIAKQLVGSTIDFRYLEIYNGPAVIDTKVKVIGILWPDDIDNGVASPQSFVNEDHLAGYVNDTFYIGELLTNTDKIDAQAFMNKYDIDSSYYADTIATQDVVNISSFASFATTVFFWASIAFFFFATMLMMNFIVVSISYRKKDIGILRAIGARSTDVLKIFVWEGVTLALISFVVTLVGLYGLTFFVNNFSKETVGIMISPIILTLRQPLLLIIIVAVVTFLACAIPVAKIARQRPIDAIKK